MSTKTVRAIPNPQQLGFEAMKGSSLFEGIRIFIFLEKLKECSLAFKYQVKIFK